LSFEIYHPKNNVHNQDGTIFFFELTDNDGQNFLAGIVLGLLTFNVARIFIAVGRLTLIFTTVKHCHCQTDHCKMLNTEKWTTEGDIPRRKN
jgi:hypothetical protein